MCDLCVICRRNEGVVVWLPQPRLPPKVCEYCEARFEHPWRTVLLKLANFIFSTG